MSFDAAFARRAREAVRPEGCCGGAGCWVECGTLATLTRASLIHCRRCNGYIGHPPHSPWRHRSKSVPGNQDGRAEP